MLVENANVETARRISSLKKLRSTEREMTTPLFLLRCVQLGLSIRDLDLLTIGMVNDMYAESRNDECKYREVATQRDSMRFDAVQKTDSKRNSHFKLFLLCYLDFALLSTSCPP